MGANLETLIRQQVASAFAGRLLTCTLRRVAAASLDSKGDPVYGSATTYSFEGFVDKFNAAFAANAGIERTDVRVLIIAGSLSTTPQKDDQVKINARGDWYQLRDLVERDPAQATYVYSAFQISDPTA